MTNDNPYAHSYADYRAAGWEGVIPLPAGRKYPPPDGFTGWAGVTPSYADCHAWAEDGGNVALRLPRGVLGVDVDAYKAAGHETITRLTATLGPLPSTWRTSARDDGLSGIYLFRVPEGVGWKGHAGPGVELVHFGHRYAVVAPSVNPDADGAVYGWQGREGTPRPADLPDLPIAWVEALRGPLPSEKAALADGEAAAWLDGMRDGPVCGPVRAVLAHALADLASAASRYDTTRDACRALVAYGGEGHRGVAACLVTLREAYFAATGAERRDTAGEWVRSLSGAVALAARVDPVPRGHCDCGTPGGFTLPPGPPPPAADPFAGAFARVRVLAAGSAEELAAAFAEFKRDGLPLTALREALKEERAAIAAREKEARAAAVAAERAAAVAAAEAEGLLLPAPFKPLDVAREIVSRLPATDGVPHLKWWRGDFYRWCGAHWERVETADVENSLYGVTEFAKFEGEHGPEDWAPDKSKVAKVLDGLGKHTVFRTSAVEDDRAIACVNGVLELEGRRLVPHSPSRFNLSSLPFAYEPGAVAPAWGAFLESSLPGDRQAHEFLQEWFGYVIGGGTDQQKIACLVGKRRGGKGTVSRVLTALLGAHNVAGATLNSLAGDFGLQSMIGRPLAVLPDVSWKARHAVEAAEILKMVSGEDSPPVNRKNLPQWNGRLPTRFMLLTNDTPTFDDASGALSGRLICVNFRVSFYGREDVGLERGLLAELPGILNWALAGLDRLRARGRFVEPASALAVKEAIVRESSRLGSFLADEVLFSEAAAPVELDDLYEHYLAWCEDEQREHVLARTGRSSFSAELLNEGVGMVRDTRIRVVPVQGRPVRPVWAHGVAPAGGGGWRKPKSGRWLIRGTPGYMP